MIPEGALREIQDRLDIVEVIGGYLPLKRSGQNLKALCPFHPEKTASFVVYPQKQFYICYGCGAAGDLLSFVMKFERLEFPEAVELLAQRAGVPFTRGSGKGSGSKDLAELYQIHEVAARLYEKLLAEAAEAREAREYLNRRGLKPETWKPFRLGYAPDRWDSLLEAAGREGLRPEVLERAGLAVPREGKSGWYDRFRHRVIFPICDPRGRVIAFGGRVLADAEEPKYLNSPETELYVKGKVLYGLSLTAPEIRQKDFCIVVEGYMDLVSPYQHGIHNVVASMGTSLTEAQVRLIRRHTRHVVMVYDGDYAGQTATLRGLDLFLEAEMRVRVATLPSGSDPDSLIREKGSEALVRVLQSSQELFDYKLSLVTRQHESKSLEGRIQICQEMLPTIKRFPSVLQRGEYIRRLGELLGVPEGLLWTEMDRVRLGGSRAASWKPARLGELPERPTGKMMDAEGLLAGLLLEDPQRIQQVTGRLSSEDLENSEVRELVRWLQKQWQEGSLPGDHREYLDRLGVPSAEIRQDAARWLAWADSMQEKEQTLEEVIERIRQQRRRASLESLRMSLRKAEETGDVQAAGRLLTEINQMLKTETQEASPLMRDISGSAAGTARNEEVASRG